MVFIFVEADGTWTVIVTDLSNVVTERQNWRLPMFAVGHIHRATEAGAQVAVVCAAAWENLLNAAQPHLAEGQKLLEDYQ